MFVGDLDLAAAETVAEEIKAAGVEATGASVDMTDDASAAAFIAAAEARYGGIDGVHVNAAVFSKVDLDVVEIELDEFDMMMRGNAGGHMRCARHAVPALLRRGGGSLLFTSSGAAHAGDPTRVAYSMAKSAIHALTRHIASRWGKEGIRSNAIAPGVVLHDQLKAKASAGLVPWAMSRVHSPRLGVSTDIAAMSALIMSDEGGFINGQIISVDGGSSMRP